MQQRQRIQQERHNLLSSQKDVGPKSRGTSWKQAFLARPMLAWLLLLVPGLIALGGAQPIVQVQAAGAGGGHDRESEATLGTKHGEQRRSSCVLIVPNDPLSAKGLATPYKLTGSQNGTACDETDTNVSVFVQAAVLDPATGQISVYDPLVINRGTKPAVAPVVPTLPANAVVGIWFGSNGTGEYLQGASRNTLEDAKCVNGLGNSIFGQVAFCHAKAFFSEANRLITENKLTPPPLGTGADGMTCSSVRDFSVVDQDPSDNVTTDYLVTQDGRLAQDTSANAKLLPSSTELGNGSDNRLLAIALDSSLGCSPWVAPDLANPGHMVTAQPLNELQAAMYQPAPVALVPSEDPMTLVNGQPSLVKQNLYRAGVDQPLEPSAAQASADQQAFCRNLVSIAPDRIEADKAWTVTAPSLDPQTANNLFTFLAARLSVTLGPDGGLNCTGLLHIDNPVQLTESGGVVVDASFSTLATSATTSQTSTPAQTSTTSIPIATLPAKGP